jgi:heterodisulfide reductase subunit C
MKRTLNLKVDKAFFSEVKNSHIGRTLPYCYQCGTCSSSCPVAGEMDIKPHEMVELIKMGRKEALAQSKAIWQCSTCYMCTERCPQGVQLTSIILNLRDIAMREGVLIPEAVKESCKNLFDTGRLLPLSQFQKDRRVKLQLPDVPPIDTNPIKGLVNKTRVANILEVK